MDESLREQIALFRYGVISELVSRPLAPGEKTRLLMKISEQEWTIPGTHRRTIARETARDWVAHYEAMGLDGLKPRTRSDKGTSRVLPEPVQDLLLRLRRERPKASVSSLIRTARLSGEVDAEVDMTTSTVYRLLAAHGLDPKIDRELAEELLADFQDADVLGEIKSFRWYNDGRPLNKLRSVRLSLRRWVANAKKRSFS